MKFSLLISLVLIASCGKKASKDCKSGAQKFIECLNTNATNYGTAYAEYMCKEAYNKDKCY